jgi:hypothetical protein
MTMKRFLLPLLAATAIGVSIPAVAGAQTWMSINQRQAELDRRIDVGVRSGQLTPAEAARVRAEFQDILRLEANYRRDGLSYQERAELDRRFDMLENRVIAERRDDQRRYGENNRYEYDRWQNLNRRQAQFNQRLRQAVRDRRLTQRQADNLRYEFERIARLERDYRRGGLTPSERADLDARMDRLQLSFRQTVNANQYGYGYGQAPNLFDYIFGIR